MKKMIVKLLLSHEICGILDTLVKSMIFAEAPVQAVF
jgi:hypothetical protein